MFSNMNTPKNFALQLGALITLYASIASLTALLFGIVTILFPDAADSYYVTERVSQTIRFSIATLIVVFPIYLWLTRSVNQIRRHEEGMYLALTKWLIYLSLLVGGAVLVGDFIAVINGFLNGELTTRFALKAFILAAVVLAAFYYYLKDAQGHWQTHEKTSLQFGAGAVAIVFAALILGFVHSETPQEVRESRIDDNQITDLQNIQWRIEEFYQINNALPTTIEDAFGTLSAPTAPTERSAYEYKLTGTSTYELCATFAQDSASSEYSRPVSMYEPNYSWTHKAGEWCFKRTVGTEIGKPDVAI